MSKPTLYYFDFDGGRAEPARLAFNIGGVDFVDHRFKGAQWPELKPQMPLGSVPVLEIPGSGKLTQGDAILLYAGNLAKLNPTDPLALARVQEVLFVLEEISQTLGPSFQEKDLDKKIAMRKEWVEKKGSPLLTGLDKIIGANSTKGFCVGDKLTVADLKLFVTARGIYSGMLDGIEKTWIDTFPNLKAVYDQTQNNEKVKAYYASRSK